MNLTVDQKEALNKIIEFINSPIHTKDDVSFMLYAAAGCGKSYLTRVISDKVRSYYTIMGVAPTHKARKVLEEFLNKDSFVNIETITIASLLNSMRGHSYIGTKRYVRGGETKLGGHDLFIIDEASMIVDDDVQLIINIAYILKRKILFIGDKYQIPNPSQQYICTGDFATKKDSIAFDVKNKYELVTNMRQSDNNPIITNYNILRDAIKNGGDPILDRTSIIKNDIGIIFYNNKKKWEECILNEYSKSNISLHDNRIIVYTNDSVQKYNKLVRKLFKRGCNPEVGELLMGYNNLGWPEKIIENSQDYYVISKKFVTTKTISSGVNKYTNIIGDLLMIKEVNSQKTNEIFLPFLSEPSNQPLLLDLVNKAEKVNKKKSSKDDYKAYMTLKNKLVFMENIFKFNGEILSESQFKNNNKLLFKNINEVIEDIGDGERKIISNNLSKEISEKYEELLIDRMDDDKPISGTEKICDRYCVIEKDIDYGICITAHKSQGSNFEKVFIDETDFDKLDNYWNYKIMCTVNVSKEKNQLKYVSYTRPKSTAFVYYKD